MSRNELLALVKRVFEVLFGKAADYEAMAEQIVWLECHGLDGLDLLREVVKRDASDELRLGKLTSRNDLQDRALIKMDARGMSLLCCADVIGDLAIGRCEEAGVCCIEVVNARDVQAIVSQFSRIGLAGKFGAVWSSRATESTGLYARVQAGLEWPEIHRWPAAGEQGELVSLDVIVASTEEKLQRQLRESDFEWPDVEISPDDLARSYRENLSNGIAVGDMTSLVKIADRILVEASDASRKGAGE